MKALTLLAAIAATGLSYDSKADEYLSLNLTSHHFNDQGYNEDNFGIGYQSSSFVIGGYKNSEANKSYYLGLHSERIIAPHTRIGIEAGLVTGYKAGSIIPYVLPNIQIGDTVKYKLGFIPISGGVLTLQINVRM